MELIQPSKQKVWGWSAVINFVLGGMGAGFYLLSALATVLRQGIPGLVEPAAFKLVAPVLVCLGFLALAAEAGHPLRGRHLLRHLRRSWMSRESLAGAIFVLAALLDCFFPSQALEALAAVAALGLLVSHGFILHRALAMAAWNVPLMPTLFVTSGLAMGGGLLLLAPPDGMGLDSDLAAAVLVCVVLDLATWLLYLQGSRAPSFRRATKGLRRPTALLFTTGIGHLLPALLLAPLLIGPWGELDAERGRLWVVLAGLSTIASGVGQKTGIVLKAGYLRGMGLKGLKSDARGRKPVFPLWLPPVDRGDGSDEH